MSCNTSEYRELRAVLILLLVLWLAGVPLALAVVAHFDRWFRAAPTKHVMPNDEEQRVNLNEGQTLAPHGEEQTLKHALLFVTGTCNHQAIAILTLLPSRRVIRFESAVLRIHRAAAARCAGCRWSRLGQRCVARPRVIPCDALLDPPQNPAFEPL